MTIDAVARPEPPTEITITLSPDDGKILALDAAEAGLDPAAFAAEIVERELSRLRRPHGRSIIAKHHGDQRAVELAKRQLRMAEYIRAHGRPKTLEERELLAERLGVSTFTVVRDSDAVLAALADPRPSTIGGGAGDHPATDRVRRHLQLAEYIKRHGPPVGETAKRRLGEQLGVSQRTLYRDVETVIAALDETSRDPAPIKLRLKKVPDGTGGGRPPKRRRRVHASAPASLIPERPPDSLV